MKTINVSGGLRTDSEKLEASRNREWFEKNPGTWEEKMEHFPKYVKRQNLTRFIALYEIFKLVLNVKGSIIECGVNQGFGLMTWAKLSAILEPVNLTRRIYGFDTFSGFPSVGEKDRSDFSQHLREGDLAADVFDELQGLADIYDSTRYLGHIGKINLVRGDACKTIPEFVEANPHVLVSLLFMDFDLYDPTIAALKAFLPRMPAGAVIAFDELDNPLWPGETQAMLEYMKDYGFRLQRSIFDPYIGYAVLD